MQPDRACRNRDESLRSPSSQCDRKNSPDDFADCPSRLCRSESGKSALSCRSNRLGRPAPDARNEPARARCFDEPIRFKGEPCSYDFQWQRNPYVRDDCGSGIRPTVDCKTKRVWCHRPLSMYQATIGELGRDVLCGETRLVRDVNTAPPCTVCRYVLPPCRGYYRKYDCMRPCEEEYVGRTQGRKTYRDPVEQYWQPCRTEDEKSASIRKYAAHNACLGEVIRRKLDNATPCW